MLLQGNPCPAANIDVEQSTRYSIKAGGEYDAQIEEDVQPPQPQRSAAPPAARPPNGNNAPRPAATRARDAVASEVGTRWPRGKPDSTERNTR